MWKKGERVQYITSGCEKLVQKEYKRQRDNVAKKVHWDIVKKWVRTERKVVLSCSGRRMKSSRE